VKIAAAVAAGLIVAGAAAAATSGEPKKVIIPAVQAKAKAINVRLSDLPAAAGFKAKPGSPDNGTPKCSYYNPDQSDLTENGDAKSPEFTLASGSFVASSTSIFKTATQGRTGYARVVQPKLPKCLGEIFRKGAAPTKVTIVSAAERAFPKLAERSNAYRIQASFTSGARKIGIFLEVVVFNRAKVDTVIFFAGIGGSYNDSFEQGVARAVAARSKNQ
jgi:hypothetical protein